MAVGVLSNPNLMPPLAEARSLGNASIDMFHAKGTINSLASGLLTGITPIHAMMVLTLVGLNIQSRS